MRNLIDTGGFLPVPPLAFFPPASQPRHGGGASACVGAGGATVAQAQAGRAAAAPPRAEPAVVRAPQGGVSGRLAVMIKEPRQTVKRALEYRRTTCA